MTERPTIVGVAASNRSRCTPEALRAALEKCPDRTALDYAIEKLAFNKQLSNSDACLLASLFGVSQEGCTVEILRLKDFFPHFYPTSMTPEQERKLLDLISGADGFVISTPVYFGSASSYVHDFVAFLAKHGLIESRVFGLTAVGAKRNGGQETTIVQMLTELNKRGAIVCGNGPTTSQYGGTAHAGDLSAIRSDTFGLDTSVGVGRKVARTAEILRAGVDSDEAPIPVQVWVLKDRDSFLAQRIHDVFGEVGEDLASLSEVEVLDLTGAELQRCLGCSICPHDRGQTDDHGRFKDKIQGDDLAAHYPRLISAEALLVAGYNPAFKEGLRDAYQVFMERTRQIRRDDFLLSDVPISAFTLEEAGAGIPFSQHVLLSFLRHNAILLPPVEEFFLGSPGDIEPQTTEGLRKFLQLASRVRKGRKAVGRKGIRYAPVGYDLGLSGRIGITGDQGPEE